MGYQVESMKLEQHRDVLVELWCDNMTDAGVTRVAAERLHWLYEQKPNGSALTWLCSDDSSGEVIGCGSIVPHQMLVQGENKICGIHSDFAVNKKHRTAGAAIAIQRAVAKGGSSAGFDLRYCYPSNAALPIFRRIRYQAVGEVQLWIKPLCSEYKVRERISSPGLARLVSSVIDVGLRFNDRLTNLKSPRNFWVRIADRADEAFDKLWAETQPDYITGVRSSAYLNWRYADFPQNNYRFFCVYHELLRKGVRATNEEQLFGYVVYYVKDNIVFVADLFCNFNRDLDLLLFAFVDRMRKERHYSISVVYVGNSFLAKALKSQHFIKRPNTRAFLVSMDETVPESMKNAVLDVQNWFLVDGELDI